MANHTTETALLTVYNVADKGQQAVLIFYTTAFDTINHDTFFQLLSNKFGINGCALNWFKHTLHCKR